jgi:hypothetical protein
VSFDGDCGRIGVKWIMAYEFYGLDINKESAAFGFMTANRMTLLQVFYLDLVLHEHCLEVFWGYIFVFPKIFDMHKL